MILESEPRKRAVLDAAAGVLVEKGYAATSMLQIAKAAKASNETLYKWWPNKQALFADLVRDNAERVVEAISVADLDGSAPMAILERTAIVLLQMLTSPLAIALNRAAAADQGDTRTLGPVLAEEGRERVGRALTALMRQVVVEGSNSSIDPKQATELFVTLLVGDLQIRLATGAIPHVDDASVIARTAWAIERFSLLLDDTEGAARHHLP